MLRQVGLGDTKFYFGVFKLDSIRWMTIFLIKEENKIMVSTFI